MYLTRRSIGAVLTLGTLAAILPVNGWIALGGVNLVLAGLILWDVWAAPMPEALQPARDHPQIVSLGAAAALTIRMHNPVRRPLTVACRDWSPPSLNRSPQRHEARVAPGSWTAFLSEVRPARRGLSTIGPITVRAAGPLGLAGRQKTLPLESSIRIYPALPSRRKVLLRLERTRVLQSGEHSSAIRGGGTDFDSVREYHPDDEFRRINWKATARSTKPITNLYREEKNQQVFLLLDASRMMAASIGGLSRLEHAIDAGLAVAELATRVGDQVGMLAFGSRVVALMKPRSGRDQPRKILDAIYNIEPVLAAPNYSQAFATLLQTSRRRSLLVLLTELTDESAMEALFQAMPPLLTRHLAILASVADPQVLTTASATPRDSEEAFLKAAAAGVLLHRERAARRLAGMGALVVDRPPDDLAAGIVDQYLKIKALGRL